MKRERTGREIDLNELVAMFRAGVDWDVVEERQEFFAKLLGSSCTGARDPLALLMLSLATLINYTEGPTDLLVAALSCIERINERPEGIQRGRDFIEALLRKGPPS
jgi:hypothetical protein